MVQEFPFCVILGIVGKYLWALDPFQKFGGGTSPVGIVDVSCDESLALGNDFTNECSYHRLHESRLLLRDC